MIVEGYLTKQGKRQSHLAFLRWEILDYQQVFVTFGRLKIVCYGKMAFDIRSRQWGIKKSRVISSIVCVNEIAPKILLPSSEHSKSMT
jgi:hypothetical protein